MFTDLFSYAPPGLDDITVAVESYQRVACARFFQHMRASDPRQQPLEVTGDNLYPDPRQLHAEVRALRHLTAIQRTLRESGGHLFSPDSPIPSRDRCRIVCRRLDAIEDAFGDASESNGESECSSREFVPEDASSADSGFYLPPEIEDLVSAVNYAQKVFVARAELLDKRRLQLSSDDFLLEIASLRDLTAVIRTLRRMSAQPLQEDEPLGAALVGASAAQASPSVPMDPRPSAAGTVSPPAPVSPSDPAGNGASPSLSATLRDASNEKVSPLAGSVESVKSSEPSVSDSPVARRTASADRKDIPSLRADRALRPVPRVPEVRSISPRPNGAAPAPPPPSPNSPVLSDEETASRASHPSHPSHPSHSSHQSHDSWAQADHWIPRDRPGGRALQAGALVLSDKVPPSGNPP